jgi:hypothetical protein
MESKNEYLTCQKDGMALVVMMDVGSSVEFGVKKTSDPAAALDTVKLPKTVRRLVKESTYRNLLIYIRNYRRMTTFPFKETTERKTAYDPAQLRTDYPCEERRCEYT